MTTPTSCTPAPPAGRCSSAGSVQEAHDFAARRPRRDAAHPGAVRALLRRLPHQPRGRQGRAARRRRPPRPRPRGRPAGVPVAGHEPRAPGRAGHGPEPRRVLPGPRGRRTPSTTPCPRSCRRSSTSSPTAPAGATRWSSTTARPTPSGWWSLMGSVPARWPRPSTPSSPRASGSAWSRCGSTGPSRPRRSCGHCHRRAPASPCSTAPRSRAPSVSRCTSTCVAAIDEAMEDDEPPFAAAPRVIGGRYGLSSKEFTPAQVAAVFAELAAPPTPPASSPSASSTTSPTSAWRRSTPPSPAPAGEVQALFFGLGSDGTVGANKSVGEDHRRGHRPLRPGLLRLRLQEVGLGHGVAPALRPRADPLDLPHRGRRLRGLPPVRAARQDEGARARPPRRHVPAQQPVRARRGVGPPARRGAGAGRHQGHRPLGRRRRGHRPHGAAWATASTR